MKHQTDSVASAKILLVTVIAVVAWFGSNTTYGASVPAGSTLVVKTLDTIRSVDVPGTRFSAQLANNVEGLKAGTKVSGKVITARRTASSTQKLTVDITDITVNGKIVPIKTTGAVELENTNFKTRNDRTVSRAGYAVSAGRVIQFKLAQPVQF
jgi:hypothetical protein